MTMDASGHPRDEPRSRGRVPSVSELLGRVLVRVVREPVILILVLAGIVDALSGSPWSHGALLVAVALGLALDRLRRRRARTVAELHQAGDPVASHTRRGEIAVAPGSARRPRFTPLAIVGGTAYAAIVGSFARFSWPATVAVFTPGIAAVVASWRDPIDPGPEPAKIEPAGALAWAGLFIALGLWELTNLLLQPSLETGSYAHPTISVLTDPVLATHAGRFVFLCLWLAFGAFLLER